jgi:hypothetical protein
MSRTDIQFPPSPTFTRFTINSDLASTRLADTLEQLFGQHAVLREALPCYRYGADKGGLSCRTVKREDVFNARFEPDKKSLIFSLDPRTSNVNYKPDYQHFNALKRQIEEMLVSHFGEANVMVDK